MPRAGIFVSQNVNISYILAVRGTYLILFCRQAVMKEAMRCCPGVSMPLERLIPEGGAAFCGTFLPEGTAVGVNPVVIHHDRTIYSNDAASFRPERWTESSAEQVKIMDRNLLTVSAYSPILVFRVG